MSLRRWDPFAELASLREQMNRMWDALRPPWREVAAPRVDVYQTEDEVVASAELPGIASKDDIEVVVTPDSLSIKGEVKRAREVKEEDYYHSERFYGSFSRTLPLPVEVKPDQARAKLANGILEVRIPKAEAGKPKTHRVPIE
ncbi:MAG: Hsp20/alpha crystallin family protein [Bacillota bacterium]